LLLENENQNYVILNHLLAGKILATHPLIQSQPSLSTSSEIDGGEVFAFAVGEERIEHAIEIRFSLRERDSGIEDCVLEVEVFRFES